MPAPAKYSITVNIQGKTLDTIKKDKHKVLALVRDIGIGEDTENGNIVFATFTADELAVTQTFTWEEEYNVQETLSTFKHGGTFITGTEVTAILRGQSVIFDANSHGEADGQSDSVGDITVVNKWKNDACVIVGCKSGNANEIVPHYISAERALQDTSTLTPVQSFSVLVSSSIKTKTMIDVTKGLTGRFEINVGKNECTINYDTHTSTDPNKQWTSIKNATKIN